MNVWEKQKPSRHSSNVNLQDTHYRGVRYSGTGVL